MTDLTPHTDADVESVARTMYLADWAEATDADWRVLPKIEATAYRRVARAVLDALAAAGRLSAPHHRPLLALTAEEVRALVGDAHRLVTMRTQRHTR